MYNQLTIVGNLGRDPESFTFDNGNTIAKFSVATTEKWKSKSGEKMEETQWHNVEYGGPGGAAVLQYLGKGSRVMVVGQQRNETWGEGDDKKYFSKVRAFKVVFLSMKGDGGGGSPNGNNESNASDDNGDFDDDIPF